jgi:hypothetical protein
MEPMMQLEPLVKQGKPPKKQRLYKRTAEVLAKMQTLSDDVLLNTAEVAVWFDVSVEWLEIGRSKKFGPKFVKLGPRLVRYTVGACRQYLAEQTYASTADCPPHEHEAAA